jgi:hypothetical protein
LCYLLKSQSAPQSGIGNNSCDGIGTIHLLITCNPIARLIGF